MSNDIATFDHSDRNWRHNSGAPLPLSPDFIATWISRSISHFIRTSLVFEPRALPVASSWLWSISRCYWGSFSMTGCPLCSWPIVPFDSAQDTFYSRLECNTPLAVFSNRVFPLAQGWNRAEWDHALVVKLLTTTFCSHQHIQLRPGETPSAI